MQDNSLPILNLPKRDDEMRAMTRPPRAIAASATSSCSAPADRASADAAIPALADGGLGSAGRLAGRPLLWFIENVDPWGFAEQLTASTRPAPAS